ncbi:hypothetical protein M408DRAFT_328614 [Serendipita vermifera MAFF 305830]|uniref:Non-structural maintenance of chromosomes element 4 n=1 Tax=Serendipita vermifera MAFF 305830 TaxID=933852 RepID=A0A0C3BE86_SERVB|nr:hypothetical protein M408DRAFT_328614 [Serendipita vermifera MAFF 305830]
MSDRSSDEDDEMVDAPAATNGRVEDDEDDELLEETSDVEADGVPLAYDPDQKMEDKRRVRAQYRELLGQQDEHRTGAAKLSISEILANQRKADRYFKEVKAPQEATLDSKVMLQNAEMGAAMARAMKHDIEAFDVDDYLAKLVTFLGGTGTPIDLAEDDDEDDDGGGRRGGAQGPSSGRDMLVDEDDGSMLSWERIGKRAFGWTRRAACMDFMVGPLSIQIKERKKATSRARLRKDARLEVQPAQLQAEDIQRTENETTKMVPLVSQALLKTGEDGVSLFEFVINPRSFGQSVENLFYVSFLVKEGRAAVYPAELEDGSEGVLTLYASSPQGEEDAGREAKKQQVFTLTPNVWREAIELFKIKKSLHIPHRVRPDEFDAEIKDAHFLA